jgi:small subunit ribosomal protein S3e
MSLTLSLKKRFVKDGLFYAEVNELLGKMLSEDGYAGVEIKPKSNNTHIVIKCTKTPEVVKKIPSIQKLLQLRYNFSSEEKLEIFAERIQARGLSAKAQAQSICYKLKGGLAVRRACYGVLRYIMNSGKAKGCQIIVSGKIRGQRARKMKFKEGYMIASGNAKDDLIVEAIEHVSMRQGIIGIRVKIMLPPHNIERSGKKQRKVN